MGHSRPRIDSPKKSSFITVTSPRPTGVRKPSPRAKPVADKTATRSTTCAYAWQAAVVLKDEESDESEESDSSEESESGSSDSSDSSEDLSPIQHRASKPKPSVSHPTLKPSALPAPAAPARTESEIENLMTIGRKQVEKKLKDRINQEKEKNRLLERQMTTFENYKKYLAKLKDLEEELTELKEENRLNEDTVADLAEDFRESTMEWAKLFEKYAGDLGISVFDIRRLADMRTDGKDDQLN
ncbi:hypothetical protein GE21DRAFT_9788 [Neurospora crassa]|uniref:Uncharacterized protein n=1 Tax=Neurospora crassa (strain ATCC 24698 / 74-OR23-1A / CBS 708.71 / DSM 1257 / FGSC 987) TaxID=367110 RepID=Q7S3G7_NEUCR|nr:hypothetical protein NCU06886 [Neurospora crassa OR74A]EAA29997.1 hypothetical protein NCU06886 [Neurospora crassa OR74A]KHE82559.1 hypothetical protein GE21DRAFT_9788 [Neurospora crassa]|eukprot:XP_959233.1 hypothetical protein NCU06886 [Neurospora crassa OR74A]